MGGPPKLLECGVLRLFKQQVFLHFKCASEYTELKSPIKPPLSNKPSLSNKPPLLFSGRKLISSPLFKPLPPPLLFFTNTWSTVLINHFIWIDPGWFIHVLEGRISFLSFAVWTPTSCIELFHFVFYLFLERWYHHLFTKLNKHPLSSKAPLPSSNVLEIK